MSKEYKKAGRNGAPVDNVTSAAKEIGNRPPQATTIVEKSILTKVNLKELLVPEPLTENQNDKEPNLFD